MRKVKVISRVSLLFFIVAMIGLALLLTGCFISRYAAYTPTPTKTPRSSGTALPATLPFDRPTIVLFPSPRGAIAQSTSVPATLSETDTPTPEPPMVMPTPTHTATETFIPLPTPRPGEPTYTPSPMPTSTPTPKATDTFTPLPTPQPGEPTYTPTATSAVTPPATDTPTSTPMPTATDTTLPTPFTATPTETSRPAETPTPEMPTSTPMVVPTPVVSGGWNLSNFYFYVVYESGEPQLHVLGVLENATGQDRESPNAIFIFRDKVGEVVATASCPVELRGVPADQWSPFHLITPVEERFASGDISVESTISRDPLRTLVVGDDDMFSVDGTCVVTGNITNPGVSLETYAEVAVWLLDEAGQTIGVGSKLLDKEDLGSGQTVPFSIEVDELLGTATRYDIVAVGL